MAHPLSSFRFRRFSSKLGLERDWYLAAVAAIIGLVMSGVAIGFILPLRWLEEQAGKMAAANSPMLIWLVILAPIIGAYLSGLIIHLLPGDRQGPGVSAVMYAIHRRRSQLPINVAIRKWIASTLTIGSGGSAGAEGPIVTIGSSIGSSIARLIGSNPQNTGTLLGCGAAAGMASVFNAPIAGIFFVLEILLRDFSLRTFTPIVIAAVISSACTRTILGNDDALFVVASNFKVAPFNLWEIPYYLALGLICGFVAFAFIRGLDSAEHRFSQLKIHWSLKPAIGAAMLALLGVVWLVALNKVPPFYGNGYGVIRQLISIDTYTSSNSPQAILPHVPIFLALAVLAALKLVSTSLTIGSGGSGGLFAPSLLMGAAVGGSVGAMFSALGQTFPWLPQPTPAHYAVVGMAAMIASSAHAPLTAILIVYEITQSYEVILPLMLTAVISTVVSRLLTPQSVYTLKLSRLGLRIGSMSDLTILRRLGVQDVPLVDPVTVGHSDSAQRLLELSEQHSVGDFVVVDEQKRYVGMVTAADLRSALVFRESIPLLQVTDLMRSDLPTVNSNESLDTVLEKFSTHDSQSLVVLRHDDSIAGMITRSRLMKRYQAALMRE